LGLIKEMAKTEKDNISIGYIPNSDTIKAMEDSKTGKVIKTKNKEEFFAKLNA
jgi:hypothetical protein